eukprot:COSAG06_NODE_8738_length_2077_cov_173.700958_2_plen_277_part_00
MGFSSPLSLCVCGVRGKRTVEVPDKYAGLVIGKGGNTIKDIMQRTGCKLNMSQRDETSTTGTRTCNFRGSPPQVQAAKILVNEIIVGAETVTALYITVARAGRAESTGMCAYHCGCCDCVRCRELRATSVQMRGSFYRVRRQSRVEASRQPLSTTSSSQNLPPLPAGHRLEQSEARRPHVAAAAALARAQEWEEEEDRPRQESAGGRCRLEWEAEEEEGDRLRARWAALAGRQGGWVGLRQEEEWVGLRRAWVGHQEGAAGRHHKDGVVWLQALLV